MAQAGYTPISLYYSTTASAAPTAGNLASGELAINITDGKLYYKDNGGVVQLIASKAGASGSVTSVAQSFTGGLISVSGSPITTSGTLALTVAGTSGGVPYFSSASTWASSAALAANALVVGGGAGAAPATITTGTGVVTALGVNTGSAGAFVVNGGALGTPSSGTLSSCTGLPVSTGISGLGTGVATALAVNVGTAGAFVVNGGALGTPSSGTVTNLTGTASININGTVGATTANTGAFTSITSTSASGITQVQAATQDGIKILGRAGGTSSYLLTFTPATLSASRTVTFPDGGGNYTVGYLNIPAVGTKTGSYTLATADVGKYVQVGSGGSITIPDATFAEGDVISVFNNTTGNITITCTITTAYIAGTDSDKASVTLATRGVATILFISGTVCVISGNVT